MSLLVLAAVATVIGFLVILMAGRGQPISPAAPAGTPREGVDQLAWVRTFGSQGFRRLLVALFGELGFEAEPGLPDSEAVEFLAVNPAPIRGGRILVQGVLAGAAVDGDAVRAILDTARAESAGRAVLVTLGRFSVDAREAARDNPIDLLDGDDLAALMKKHLPQAYATQVL